MPPISPSDAAKRKDLSIPDEVIEVWNDLIVEAYDGSSANIKQDKAAKAIAKKMKVTTNEVFERKWLDIESLFTKAGWSVKYDKPCYYGGDNYEAYFEFSKKRR